LVEKIGNFLCVLHHVFAVQITSNNIGKRIELIENQVNDGLKKYNKVFHLIKLLRENQFSFPLNIKQNIKEFTKCTLSIS
jgi:hypothetical protein